ncbi:MAG TPA: hypothetical protein VGM14_08930 [Streptosporangiaceae bacterium]|jgi:hypothetical protein
MIRSAREFLELRSSADPDSYRRAASEPAAPEIWQELIAEHPPSRFWVAQNKTVPLAVLRQLAGDEDPRVRTMVAMKRKLDEATFSALAADPDAGVRMMVARNAKTPPAVLQSMLADSWLAIRELARERLGPQAGDRES